MFVYGCDDGLRSPLSLFSACYVIKAHNFPHIIMAFCKLTSRFWCGVISFAGSIDSADPWLCAMIEYVVMGVGAVISVVMMVNQKKTRLEPLKNSEKVAIEINTESSLESLHIHLPPPHFIKNMSVSVDRERMELATKWSYEKNLFPVLWRKLSIDQRKQLINTLLEELVFSIGVYSDTDKLLPILCPKLTTENLLARDANADSNTPEQEASTELFRFLLAAQDKTQIKPYCLPLLVRSLQKVDRDIDPNREEKDDAVLAEHVDLFLRSLQHLCALKFAKQVLTRYKTTPTDTLIARVAKKIAPVLLVGILAALLALLLDRFGFLQIFLVSYKSPFN